MTLPVVTPDDSESWTAEAGSAPIPIADVARMAASAAQRRVGHAPSRVDVALSYHGHLVCRIDFDAVAPLYFKTGDSDHLKGEAWIYQTLAAHDVSAPQAVDVDVSTTLFPRPFMLTTEVPGIPLHRETAADPKFAGALHATGVAMRAVHSIQIDGCGSVLSGGIGTDRDWWMWIQAAIDQSLKQARAQQILADDELEQTRTVVSDTVARMTAADHGCLLHGDLLLRHVRVTEDGEFVGLIDFNCNAGDPLYDFAVTAMWDGVMLPPLLDGYGGSDLDVPAWPLYGLQRAIGEAVFMHGIGLEISGQLHRVGEFTKQLS